METNGDKISDCNSNQYEVFRTDVKTKSYLETKSVKWKYFVCALFINVRYSNFVWYVRSSSNSRSYYLFQMILSCPVYVYGLFLVQEPSTKDVWPPIIFNSVYLMLTPQFFKSYSFIHRLSDRAGTVIGVIIASVGITINGLLLSSSDPHYLIGTFFYGGLGGKACCNTILVILIIEVVLMLKRIRWVCRMLIPN